jgi:hypothetical protein
LMTNVPSTSAGESSGRSEDPLISAERGDGVRLRKETIAHGQG